MGVNHRLGTAGSPTGEADGCCLVLINLEGLRRLNRGEQLLVRAALGNRVILDDENDVRLPDGCQVITLFPSKELFIANKY